MFRSSCKDSNPVEDHLRYSIRLRRPSSFASHDTDHSGFYVGSPTKESQELELKRLWKCNPSSMTPFHP